LFLHYAVILILQGLAVGAIFFLCGATLWAIISTLKRWSISEGEWLGVLITGIVGVCLTGLVAFIFYDKNIDKPETVSEQPTEPESIPETDPSPEDSKLETVPSVEESETAPSQEACPPLIPDADANDIPALKAAYCHKQQAYAKQQASIEAAKKQVEGLEKAMQSATQAVSDSKTKMDNAQDALKQAQENVLNDPEQYSSEQERLAYGDAKTDFEEKEQALKQLEEQLAQAKQEVEAAPAAIENTQKEMDELEKQLKAAYFDKFTEKFEQERIVESDGKAECDEQRSVKQCKDDALQDAQNNASKQGKVLFLDSETWASLGKEEDWKLTKEEITNQLEVEVTEHEVLEEGCLDKGTGYSYKIRATVKGKVPPDLEPKILGQ